MTSIDALAIFIDETIEKIEKGADPNRAFERLANKIREYEFFEDLDISSKENIKKIKNTVRGNQDEYIGIIDLLRLMKKCCLSD
jgi:hypothetical protein